MQDMHERAQSSVERKAIVVAGIQDPTVLAGVTEKQLQSAVVEAMGYMGWLTYHTHDSRRSNPGFPDIVAVKGSRLIFLELKSEKGKVRAEQVEWLDVLIETHSEVYLVRPSTQDAFMRTVARLGSDVSTHWRNVRQPDG